MNVIESFKGDAEQRGGLLLFSTEKALEIVNALERAKVAVLGLDAFRLGPNQTQPLMEHSIDLSYSQNSWSEARTFLEVKRQLSLKFELVADE